MGCLIDLESLKRFWERQVFFPVIWHGITPQHLSLLHLSVFKLKEIKLQNTLTNILSQS